MSSASDRIDQPSLVRRPSIVLKPYAGADKTIRRLLMNWSLVPTLALFCFVYGFFYALFTPYMIVMFLIPPLVIGALTIWALPDMRHAPTRPLIAFFFTFYVALIVWPNYLGFSFPGMPWVTITRLVGFPLAFLLLVCLSVSKSFRTTLNQTVGAVPILWKLVLTFAAIQLVSMGFSHSLAQSLQKFMLAQVEWTAMFFVSCYVFLKPGRVERWAAMMWIMALFVCLIGVWEHHLGHVPWRDHIPFFLKIGDPTVTGILIGGTRDATGLYRTQSTFDTSLSLAEYLALTLPFVLHFIAGDYKLWVRLAGIATLPLFLDVVVATDSRLGSVGFLMAFSSYPLFWSLLRWRRIKNSLIGPAIVLAYPVLFIAGIGAVLSIHKLRIKVFGGTGAQAASNEGRAEQFKQGIPKILKHPWGYGIGMGADALGFHSPGGVLTIDSYFLSIALEYGVVGFIVFYGMLALAVRYGAKYAIEAGRYDREYSLLIPITIALANFIVIKAVFSQQENHALVFMMLGMLVALVYRIRGLEATAMPAKAAAQIAPRFRLLPSPARRAH